MSDGRRPPDELSALIRPPVHRVEDAEEAKDERLAASGALHLLQDRLAPPDGLLDRGGAVHDRAGQHRQVTDLAGVSGTMGMFVRVSPGLDRFVMAVPLVRNPVSQPPCGRHPEVIACLLEDRHRLVNLPDDVVEACRRVHPRAVTGHAHPHVCLEAHIT